jgi:NADPH2:quinone reductase
VPGGPDVLQVVDRPAPVPAPGEVLIAVVAAGVNRPDLMQRQGHYPPPPGITDIPGLEVAGHIVACGPPDDAGPPQAASRRIWQVGDAVCALVAGGGYAEQVAVPGGQCLPIPDGVDLTTAAALPETYFTVWTNIFERGRLQAGEWLLVHGGTSGIGTTAIQLAVARGSRVLATAGTDEKCRACERLGATRAINYRAGDFVAAVKAATGDRGADVILDIVGAPYTMRNLDCLAPDGRLVQIGVMGGSAVEIPLILLMRRRLTITGSTLRNRSPREKGVIAAAVEREVRPLVARGASRPVIDAVVPFADVAGAHERLERGDVVGKIVLRVS